MCSPRHPSDSRIIRHISCRNDTRVFPKRPSVPTLYLRYFRNERMYCRNVRKHLYTQSAHPAPFRSRFLTDRTWDRPLLSGLNRLFDIKLAETDLMLGETPDRNIRRSAQLSLLLKASLSQEELQIQTAEKAQRFEKNYHKMIRFGFFAILTIPLIFLILMFSLESKIVFLILWILSIILIATWLITVEYIHNELAAQQELSGMSFEEMLKLFRKMEEN